VEFRIDWNSELHYSGLQSGITEAARETTSLLAPRVLISADFCYFHDVYCIVLIGAEQRVLLRESEISVLGVRMSRHLS
jgi:hypothetical protein